MDYFIFSLLVLIKNLLFKKKNNNNKIKFGFMVMLFKKNGFALYLYFILSYYIILLFRYHVYLKLIEIKTF